MTHAAEWGHWYDRDGNPVYEIMKADKSGLRPVNLKDARKLGLVPGVSGVMGCAAKPALDRWKVKQGILAALTLPRTPGETDDSYIDRVTTDAGEQARKAAERGSAIHAAIQGHYEGEAPAPELWAFVSAVKDRVSQWGNSHAWSPEQSFSHPYGFGGKVDLHNQDAVIDFKTKEFTQADLDEGKVLAWDEHVMQLAAYRAGLKIPTARCANCFVSVNEPGLTVIVEHSEADLKRGWEMFVSLLGYWKASKKYDGSFQEKRAA